MTTLSKAKSTPQKTKPASKSPVTKISLIVRALSKPSGATIEDLQKATGWQAHSVRGALAGSLKQKGYTVASEK